MPTKKPSPMIKGLQNLRENYPEAEDEVEELEEIFKNTESRHHLLLEE